MSVVVFAGPTLSAADASRVLDADYRPPAAQGDVYAAATAGARVIGIVDGYFERVPAVWHKEILWALSQRVHVFGAASMGALRAAELHAFGMLGVGRVFEAFRDGLLEDDDEVTVVHAAAESGYRAASEAMVNIRFTLAAARQAGVIGPVTEAALVARGKRTFYPHRTWQRLLERDTVDGPRADPVDGSVHFDDGARDHAAVATAPQPDPAELAALGEWLPDGRVDRKRLDALEMLHAIASHVAAGAGPLRPRFRFQRTDAWEEVRRQIDGRALAAAVPDAPREHAAILDEVRLLPDGGAAVRQAALLRSLALALADEHAGDAALEQTVAAFRAEHGLNDGPAVARWRDAQHVTEEELLRLLDDEARIRSVLAIYGADLDRHVAATLRMAGGYGGLAERAQRKQQALAARGLENPSLLYLGITEAELWHWFSDRMAAAAAATGHAGEGHAGEGHAGKEAVPDHGGAATEEVAASAPLDPVAAAAARGFDSVDAFRRAVLREYCFQVRAGG